MAPMQEEQFDPRKSKEGASDKSSSGEEKRKHILPTQEDLEAIENAATSPIDVPRFQDTTSYDKERKPNAYSERIEANISDFDRLYEEARTYRALYRKLKRMIDAEMPNASEKEKEESVDMKMDYLLTEWNSTSEALLSSILYTKDFNIKKLKEIYLLMHPGSVPAEETMGYLADLITKETSDPLRDSVQKLNEHIFPIPEEKGSKKRYSFDPKKPEEWNVPEYEKTKGGSSIEVISKGGFTKEETVKEVDLQKETQEKLEKKYEELLKKAKEIDEDTINILLHQIEKLPKKEQFFYRQDPIGYITKWIEVYRDNLEKAVPNRKKYWQEKVDFAISVVQTFTHARDSLFVKDISKEVDSKVAEKEMSRDLEEGLYSAVNNFFTTLTNIRQLSEVRRNISMNLEPGDIVVDLGNGIKMAFSESLVEVLSRSLLGEPLKKKEPGTADLVVELGHQLYGDLKTKLTSLGVRLPENSYGRVEDIDYIDNVYEFSIDSTTGKGSLYISGISGEAKKESLPIEKIEPIQKIEVEEVAQEPHVSESMSKEMIEGIAQATTLEADPRFKELLTVPVPSGVEIDTIDYARGLFKKKYPEDALIYEKLKELDVARETLKKSVAGVDNLELLKSMRNHVLTLKVIWDELIAEKEQRARS